MTALDIIIQARERLGDLKGQRWSDSRMLSIVSQGQVEICLESGYLRKEALIPLVVGTTRYNLPADLYSVKRVEFDDKLLPLFTRSDKDDPRINIKSDYTAYKSNIDMRRIDIEPAVEKLILEVSFVRGDTLEDTLSVNPLFGVVTSTNAPNITVEPDFGVTVGIALDITNNEPSDGHGEVFGSNLDVANFALPNGVFGVAVSAEYTVATDVVGVITSVKGHTVSGTYGIVANISALKDTFRVFYVAVPRKLTQMNSELSLPELWESILIRYVVGTALQDDNDANNIQRGEIELTKYISELAKVSDLSSKDFSANTSDKNETSYRRI